MLKDQPNNPKRFSKNLYQEMIGLSNIIQKLIVITGITAAVVFAVWSRDGIGVTARMMLLLLGVNVILFFVHKRGYSSAAGLTLFATTATIITTLAYDADGIYSLPHIFYPILLIFSGILFGRAMIPYVTGLVIILNSWLFYLDRIHVIIPLEGKVSWAPDYFTIVIIILLATASVLWVTLKTIEENLLQVALSEKIIKESYELTLEGWAKALELSGREPEGHSKRVIELVMAFANDLGMDEEKKSLLRHGALLHDIGKMGIPDYILLKPSPLSDEEHGICREHAAFAKRVLVDIDYLESLTDIPVYHHEQWDGNGYPDGLAEENIPYLARIFSVIDNWVSLTSQQVYRPAWSDDQARSYIQEESGKKFDRDIVNSFLIFLHKNGGEHNER